MSTQFFYVTVDEDRMLQHLADEDGEPKTRADLHDLLTAAGFRFEVGTQSWFVSERDLAHVRPDEVVTIEKADGAIMSQDVSNAFSDAVMGGESQTCRRGS